MAASEFRRTPFLLLLLATVLMTVAGSAVADKAWKQGNSKAAGMQQCVRPTDFMRRNHMEIIKHQRDVTVHQGVRKTPDSLAGCVSCHANKDQGHWVPVTSEGQFCQGCHAYTGTTLDCFQCHSTVPAEGGN